MFVSHINSNSKKNTVRKNIKSIFSISNVVTTCDLKQKVNISKLKNLEWGIYDPSIYGGRCGYVKIPDMQGRVTIFPSGKMISVGTKSVKKSIHELKEVISYLTHNKIISKTKVISKVQNIVGTLTLPNGLRINSIVKKIPGCIYEPGQFAGIILKSIRSISYMIFSSGKVVIVGAKSENELSEAVFEIREKLNGMEL